MSNVFDLYGKISIDTSGFMSALSIAQKAISVTAKAVTNFAKSSVQSGMTFDKSMSQVAATMGKSMSQMEKEVGTVDLAWGEFSGNLRDYALEMGKNTAFSASEAADALNYMALAGYDTQTSMEMLPNVLNLAAAGTMDLARASDMVTDTQTAFGITIERTTQMVDEMAKAASTGNTSVSQLGDAFLVVSGLAQELNGGIVSLSDGTTASVDGIQELEIALTAMANAGIKGSEAGTHMRNMLLKLSGPSDAGAIALSNLGVAVFDTEGNMRSLADIFGDLKSAFDGDLQPSFENFYKEVSKLSEKEIAKELKKDENAFTFFGVNVLDSANKIKTFKQFMSEANAVLENGITQEEKIQEIGDLFNARDIASAKALLNAITGEYVKIGEEVYSIDEAYEKWGNDIYDSSKGFEVVRTSWDKIGESILNADGAAQKMAETQLDNLAGDVTYFKSALEGAQITLSDVLTPTLREFVQFGTEQLGVLTNAFKEDGIDGLMSAIGDGLSQGINLIISKLPEIMRHGRKILMSLIKGMIDNLPQIVKTAAEIITELATGVVKALPELIPAVVKCIRTIVDTLTKPDMLTQIWQAALELVIELVEGIVENLDELIEAAFLIIDNLVEFILKPENLSKLIECMFRVQVALGEGLIKAIPEALKGITELIWRMGEAIFATDWSDFGWDILMGIGDGFKKAWNDLKSWWYGMWDTLAGSARDFWNKIKDAFSPMGQHFYNFGQSVLNGLKSIINGLVWGINEVIAFPFNKLNDALRTIKNVNILGAKPFDWIQEIGVPQIPYLAKGGVLKKGQMAFLEGQGDEVVIPLSQNTEWIDKVAEKLGEKRQSVYYNFEIHIDKMGQTSEDDIEQFADRLMEVMNEKESRRRYVMV